MIKVHYGNEIIKIVNEVGNSKITAQLILMGISHNGNLQPNNGNHLFIHYGDFVPQTH